MITAAIITGITNAILNRLIQTPSVPVSRDNSVVVKPGIEQAVRKEIAPVIEHLTNNEPWYRSNVTWGAIFAIMGGTATIGTHVVMGTRLSFEAYGTPALAIWGGIQALYGRWKARKPLGV